MFSLPQTDPVTALLSARIRFAVVGLSNDPMRAITAFGLHAEPRIPHHSRESSD